MHYFMSHNLFTLLQHSFFFICVMQRNFLFKSVWQCPLSLSVASSLQGERWVLGTPRRKRLLLHFAHSSGTFIFAFFCMSWHIRRGWRPERKKEVCGTLSLSSFLLVYLESNILLPLFSSPSVSASAWQKHLCIHIHSVSGIFYPPCVHRQAQKSCARKYFFNKDR